MTFEGNYPFFDSDIDGDSHYGEAESPLDHDEDLFLRTPWGAEGFVVVPYLDSTRFGALKSGCTEIVQKLVESVLSTRLRHFELKDYHRYAQDAKVHARVLELSRKHYALNMCFPISLFPISPTTVTELASEICGTELTLSPSRELPQTFTLRMIRPQSNDHNPFHRDVWLDRLRLSLNSYCPLAGSNDKSSLRVVPGSHRWKEQEIRRTCSRAHRKGMLFGAPAVTHTTRPFKVTRPNPKEGELLLFSPYLIHGGSANLNESETRVSIEMRFWRATDYTWPLGGCRKS